MTKQPHSQRPHQDSRKANARNRRQNRSDAEKRNDSEATNDAKSADASDFAQTSHSMAARQCPGARPVGRCLTVDVLEISWEVRRRHHEAETQKDSRTTAQDTTKPREKKGKRK